MLIVGLTGSIGMGKSTAAAHLRARGIPVFDADAEVHRLYAGGEAVDPVERAFPGTTTRGGVDRAKLSAALLAQPERFAELEAIVHPLVRNAERTFLREHAQRGTELVVLEIPLLFETGADKLVDVTIVVSADARGAARPADAAAGDDGGKARQAAGAADAGCAKARARRFRCGHKPSTPRRARRRWTRSYPRCGGATATPMPATGA